MFDFVDFRAKCPRCGDEVTGFQTKDDSCGLRLLWPHEVSIFYAPCKKCRAWINCEYVPPGIGKIKVSALVDTGDTVVGEYETSWNPDDYPKNHHKELPNP
jgi:hypothetical protein